MLDRLVQKVIGQVVVHPDRPESEMTVPLDPFNQKVGLRFRSMPWPSERNESPVRQWPDKGGW